MAAGAFIPAYKAFRAVLERVADFRDANALLQDALQKGRYRAGLCVFLSGNLRTEMMPTKEEKGRFSRIIDALGKAGRKDLLKKGADLDRVHEDLYRRMSATFERRAPVYVEIVGRFRVQKLLEDRGVNPDLAHRDQILEASRDAGIPVVVLAELTTAYSELDTDKKERKAVTTRRESYTDDQGKKKRREIVDKRYTYYRIKQSQEAAFLARYQILETAAGSVIDQGEFESYGRDEVDYVNWNKYDDVRPSQLRLEKNDGKFGRLPSDDAKAFDTRSHLKTAELMYEAAAEEIGTSLSRRILTVLDSYTPSPSQPAGP